MFRKRAFGTDNLAATTEAATTADRVNINPQNPRGMEQRRIHRKAATATRGGKNHFHLFICLIHAFHYLSKLFFCDRHEPALPLREPARDRL